MQLYLEVFPMVHQPKIASARIHAKIQSAIDKPYHHAKFSALRL